MRYRSKLLAASSFRHRCGREEFLPNFRERGNGVERRTMAGIWGCLPALFFAVLAFLGSVHPLDAQDIPHVDTHILLGTWLTRSRSEITIEPCEVGLCGAISKIVVPDRIREKYGDDVIAQQKQFTDVLNKDPALRSRPILGLRILELVSQSAPDRLEGSIYNPENGETFEGFMEILDNDTVRLSGCVLFNLVCMGEDWQRVQSRPD